MKMSALLSIVCTNPEHAPKRAFIDNIVRNRDEGGIWKTNATTRSYEGTDEIAWERRTMTFVDDKTDTPSAAPWNQHVILGFDPLFARRVFNFRCPLSEASSALHCPAVDATGERIDPVLDAWVEATRGTPFERFIPLKELAARVSR